MANKPKMNRELVGALLDHDHPTPWEVQWDLNTGWEVFDAEANRIGSFLVEAHAHAICDMASEME